MPIEFQFNAHWIPDPCPLVGEPLARGRFLRGVVLPNLVSSWCVWIPVVLALYSFPGELQVQVLGLVCSFWSLMSLEIGRRCAIRPWSFRMCA